MSPEIGLDLGVSRSRDLRIDFLLQQLLSGNSEFRGLGFEELLADQAVQGLTLELVFLIAQLHQLGAERLQQLLLRDRLTGDSGDRAGRAGSGSSLGAAGKWKTQTEAKN